MSESGEMEKHLSLTQWHYVVPPKNTVRVTVEVSHMGQDSERWYVSIEELSEDDGLWVHRRGASSGHNTEAQSMDRARRLWEEERAKS